MDWVFLGTTQGGVLSRNPGTRVPVSAGKTSLMVVKESMWQLFDWGWSLTPGRRGMTRPEFLGVWKRDPDSRVDSVQAFYKGNLGSCLLSRA